MKDGLDDAARVLEAILLVIVLGSAIVVVGVAALIMVTMDVGSKTAGGRFYVAFGASVLLLFLDDQARRAMMRHRGTPSGDARYHRHLVRSVVLLLLGWVALFALAFALP